MSELTLVDYGMGNLKSVSKAIESLGASVCLTSDVDKIAMAERLILPGVGAIRDAMAHLKENNLIEALEKYSPIIIDENLTKQLEEGMDDISKSSSGFEEKEKKIIEKTKKIISDISKEFKSKEEKIGKELASAIINLRKEQQEANAKAVQGL